MNVKAAATSLVLLGALSAGAAAANAATPTPAPSTSTSASSTKAPSVDGASNPLKADLDKLVKDGTITSAQETKILAGIKVGHGMPQGAPRGVRDNFHHEGSHRGGDMRGGDKALASALKLSESQLRADLAKGQTLYQIAKKQNVSQADLTSALTKDADKRVSDMVAKSWNTKMGQRSRPGARHEPHSAKSSAPTSATASAPAA